MYIEMLRPEAVALHRIERLRWDIYIPFFQDLSQASVCSFNNIFQFNANYGSIHLYLFLAAYSKNEYHLTILLVQEQILPLFIQFIKNFTSLYLAFDHKLNFQN